MIGNHGCADGRPTTAEYSFLSTIDSMGPVTYVYFSLQTARDCGWDKTPTGVMSFENSSFASNHDTV
eukprot:8030018-Pyramimonas_sp.AAC.1